LTPSLVKFKGRVRLAEIEEGALGNCFAKLLET